MLDSGRRIIWKPYAVLSIDADVLGRFDTISAFDGMVIE